MGLILVDCNVTGLNGIDKLKLNIDLIAIGNTPRMRQIDSNLYASFAIDLRIGQTNLVDRNFEEKKRVSSTKNPDSSRTK